MKDKYLKADKCLRVKKKGAFFIIIGKRVNDTQEKNYKKLKSLL